MDGWMIQHNDASYNKAGTLSAINSVGWMRMRQAHTLWIDHVKGKRSLEMRIMD